MNDDLILLASAYLDGDVTADERAQVETDPTLLAEVERLRAVRLLLGEADEPKISVREAHLAAAFEVWERLPEAERTGRRRDATPANGAAAAAAASVRAPTALRDRRRTTSTRWLTGAAAALVLVVGGALAVRFAGSTGSDDSVAEPAQSADIAESAESADAEAASDDASTFSTDAGGDGNEETAESAADAEVRLDTEFGDRPPPPEDELLQQLLTPQDLAAFAAPALGAPQAPDVPVATSAPVEEDLAPFAIGGELPLCLGADIVVGPARYGDTLVVVGIDSGRSLALAYQGDTCTEIARVALDEP
jgi:hypothetical protein